MYTVVVSSNKTKGLFMHCNLVIVILMVTCRYEFRNLGYFSHGVHKIDHAQTRQFTFLSP